MPSEAVIVEAMSPTDWDDVQTIYRQGIATGHATFETEAPTQADWDNDHRRDCRLVARERSAVVGWAALSPVSERWVYRGVAEVSVYIATAARGRGVGLTLLGALVEASEVAGVWTLQAGLFPENLASVRLHAACGFRQVGMLHRLGQQNGHWRDVLLMERRSKVAGT